MNFRHQPMGMYERIMQDRMFQQPILDHGAGMIQRPIHRDDHFHRKERSPGLRKFFSIVSYIIYYSMEVLNRHKGKLCNIVLRNSWF